MESEYLKQYLKKCDLSFTKVVNDKVIKLNNKNDITEPTKENTNKQSNVTIPEKQPNNNPFKPTNIFNKKDKINKWNIEEIELFFQKAKLPPNPIKLNDFEIIVDVKKFIESSLVMCKVNNGNETFLPYWESLLEFQKYLIN